MTPQQMSQEVAIADDMYLKGLITKDDWLARIKSLGLGSSFPAPVSPLPVPGSAPGTLFGLNRNNVPPAFSGIQGWVTAGDPWDQSNKTPVMPPENKAPEKLPPMNCIKCQFRNEYVGKEHLDKDGKYTCRSCKK